MILEKNHIILYQINSLHFIWNTGLHYLILNKKFALFDMELRNAFIDMELRNAFIDMKVK